MARHANLNATLLLLLLLGACPSQAAAGTCPDDPEADLCDLEADGAVTFGAPGLKSLGLLLTLALQRGGAAPALLPVAGVLLLATGGEAVTCGDLKTFYKGEACCGSPDKSLSAQVPGCPYNFQKPACSAAEPQSPRDLTTGATGQKTPKAATLTVAQASMLPLVNVHYHLGAEHKSDNYNNATDSEAYDAQYPGRRLAGGSTPVRPGFMCPTSDLTADQLAAYTFQHCKGDVQVGKTYEVHYVHSSAGYTAAELVGADSDGIDDGLGGAANGRGLLNPMVAVQGQVFQIVNGLTTTESLVHSSTGNWPYTPTDGVMYQGSTTGQSHDNEVCSPYAITWHVDKSCHRVSPEAFDKMCQDMKSEYNLDYDLYPHGSRTILDPAWVVAPQYVETLA